MTVSLEVLKRIFVKNKEITPETLEEELEKLRREESDEYEFKESTVEFVEEQDYTAIHHDDNVGDFTIEMNVDDLGLIKMKAKKKHHSSE